MKKQSDQFDNNRFPSNNQTSNYSSANNENSLEQSSSKPINSKNSKNENEIKVIFHAYFPKSTAKIGHPVIFVNISISNITEGHAFQYRYVIHIMEGKFVFEGRESSNTFRLISCQKLQMSALDLSDKLSLKLLEFPSFYLNEREL
ncbi:5894_t:CDS:2 [Funneliformis mosseae]|uniref:5894_t:CDS:1 n=1 Tax=Funneliformis mosseae TaxID=27381 RepID=A0A9N9B7B2_FUNMO|nr:5894_t:CDS:2 [Funneliformis mosseae]